MGDPGRDRAPTPRVFISSSAEDLKPYRAAARDAIVGLEWVPRMMEYFVAGAGTPPLSACLDRVSDCDVVVVIVAHRYGWIPPGQPRRARRSITWLECERALAQGKEVLAFLLDDQAPWPEELREEYAITAALRGGRPTRGLLTAVEKNLAGLRAFKQWLASRDLCQSFTSSEELRRKASEALREWVSRWEPVASGSSTRVAPADPTKYLRSLLARTAFIDIRGLQVGTGRAHRFPIDDLFITLTTTSALSGMDWSAKKTTSEAEMTTQPTAPIPLHEALWRPRLVAVGDPGSGKTTFLTRVANALCQTLLGDDRGAAHAWAGIEDRAFPILVRLADLAAHVHAHRGEPGASVVYDSPAWLSHFLAGLSAEQGWGLDESFFRSRLERPCVVLLDGLDEAPDRIGRALLSRLIENIGAAYPEVRIVVTSRPGAYVGETVLPGFTHVQIDPLDERAVGVFLERWCRALWPESASDAAAHLGELTVALRRPAIRRMATNPVMLTALAVVHWNERRLPEQRADLYESVLKWLARQREQRPARPTAERCVDLLQELALAMQNRQEERQVQVARRWAAEAIAREFSDRSERARLTAAERFLEAEELDSGIVVRRGNEMAFWHLTFQEFLAAKAIAARSEGEQRSILFDRGRRLYTSEWREVVLLLGGILYGQGRPKVDGFVATVLDDLSLAPRLAAEARCVGLLGAIARDLAPLQYAITDARYPALLDRVLGIFDATRAASIAVDVRIEAAEALGQAGDPRLGLDNPQRWVTIPNGTFVMGAQRRDPKKPNYDPEAAPDEWPHEVELDAYRIGRYPVTVGEYHQFVEHGGYADRRWWTAGGFKVAPLPYRWAEHLEVPNQPVTGVSWYEATAYCAWAAGRLPTEAEWERAARGTDGRRFPWGDTEPNATRFHHERYLERRTPVGVFPGGASPEGVQDLAGNVWEWCLDGHGPYAVLDRRNPRGPAPGGPVQAIVRGGFWRGSAMVARSAFRYMTSLGGRSAAGFRMVRTAQG